jgi:hypothetical protein
MSSASKTDSESVQGFIAAYDGDASAICFKWNGKHDDDFEDANEAFRDAVLERVSAHPGEAPVALVTDLYRALTEWSAEAWCIDDRVADLAREMLKRGRSAAARDFLVGAMQSFDAHCATLFSGCPRDVAEECLELTRIRLKSETDEEELRLWRAGLEHFTVLLKNAD